jgi:hypothetical protein
LDCMGRVSKARSACMESGSLLLDMSGAYGRNIVLLSEKDLPCAVSHQQLDEHQFWTKGGIPIPPVDLIPSTG